jgi:ribonuclease D
MQDQPQLEVAKRAPASVDALHQIRGLHPPFIKRRGEALLEAIRAGLQDPPIPREPRRNHSDPHDSPLIALAEALLRARAMETGLAYELLASRSELEQIIAAARQAAPEPDVRMLSGWRRELVGSDLEALLTGRTAVAVGPNHRLELQPRG